VCGILGVRRSFGADPVRIRAALSALAWRGRDDARTVEVGEWTVAVARLAISDPHSPQPVVDPVLGTVAALNGFVATWTDDRTRFAPRMQGGNDAELILHRFHADGPPALATLEGHHAFARIDPTRDEVWLGVDRFGEKPLFAVEEDGVLIAFASTLGALEALGIPFTPCEDALARTLTYGFGARARCVAPRQRLLDDLRGLWCARGRDGLRSQEITPSAPPDDPHDFQRHLRDATTRCATAVVDVALSLSGGIDSAVLAVALRDGGFTPTAWQAAFAATDPDERARAHAVAEALALPLRTLDLDAHVLDALPTLARNASVPVSDPSILAVHALARAIAAAGARVVLSGEGADELMLGYPRHRAAAHLRFRQRLPRWLAHPLLAHTRTMTRTSRWLRAAASPSPSESLLQISAPHWRCRLGLSIDDAAPPLGTNATGEDSDPWESLRAIELEHYLRLDLLPKVDVATLSAGVEARAPFLDARLARHLLAKPAAEVFGKRPLREHYASRLPPRHFAQKKRGFSIPIDRLWREHDLLADVLTDRRTLERGDLPRASLLRAVDQQRAGRARDGHPLYALVAFELWRRAREEPRTP
jgi:asparagine synthase (glutamine-hydrolysing)